MKIDERIAEELEEAHMVRFFPKVQSAVRARGLDALLEKCTQHPPGQFMPLGAYSYALSFSWHFSRIGRYCSIGKGVEVMGNAHPTDWISSSPAFYRSRLARSWNSARPDFPEFQDLGAPVEVEDDVWVGDDVLFAHGVRIGTGSIVAARAVVTGDVPPYAVVAGVPARIVRFRFDPPVIERLLQSEWWCWPIETWDDLDPTNVGEFLDRAEKAKADVGKLPEARTTPRQLLDGSR